MLTKTHKDEISGYASGVVIKGLVQSQFATGSASQLGYSTDMCVPQLVEKQSAATPDAVALIEGDYFLNYYELNQRANQLAHYLRKLGVKPNMQVGLCIERSIDMVVGFLGILKSGAAYLPLDPSYPAERLTFMLQNAQVPVLVTSLHHVAHLTTQDTRVVCLDDKSLDLVSMSTDNPIPVTSLDDLAYTIYTSGSTGRPKGVQVTHRSLLNVVFWYRELFEVTASDRATLFFSPAFDVTGEDLWSNLTAGSSLYLMDEAISFNPMAIRDWLVHNSITIANFPTVLVECLITLDWPATSVLRAMLVGGDTLHSYPPANLPFALFNNYGPSETTIVATVGRVYPNQHATTPPSIGRPIPNTYVYILDEQLQPVPYGEPGEIYIGGVGVVKGYLNRPELTAEKFVPHPFSNKPDARLYKTGDLGRYLPDGQILFLGRVDHQVKIRGFRIELGEIEAALLQHAGVSQAAVAAREDMPGEKSLVGYVVLHQGQHTTSDDLRRFLKAWLTDYMIPRVFVFLDALPVTPNGKLDRHALPALNASSRVTDEPFVAPTSSVHYLLQQIWEEELNVRPIGIRDNFFYLGGHSLLAARLMNRVEQSFGKKIPLATLFAGPTIAQLATNLQTEDEGSRVSVTPVQANGTKKPFFYLSGSWKSAAFYCYTMSRALGPEQPFYALGAYQFDDSLSPPSIESIAAAHLESIRTVQPEGPYQLGGFCNGAMMAYEMARQLHAQGEQVDMLVLIEPALPTGRNRLVCGLFNGIGGLLDISQDKQMKFFLYLRHIFNHLLNLRQEEDLKEFTTIEPSIHKLLPTVHALLQDNIAIFDWIARNYRYGPYPGKIAVIRASESWFGKVWLRKVGKGKDIELYIIPGPHMSCITTHIQLLAEKLSNYLN